MFKRPKGVTAIVGFVIGVVFVAILTPLIYVAILPVYTTQTLTGNETITMAAVPIAVNLVRMNVIPGSESVYNITNSSVTVPEGIASADSCGDETNDVNDCYYNFTDGNKWTYGTIVINATGDWYVHYQFYPASYSPSVSDRLIMPMILTFLLIGVVFVIAKGTGIL